MLPYCPMYVFFLDTPSSPKIHNVRGKTMGRGLEKICERQGTRLTISVSERKMRPEHPVQAVKLASECGVALRDHLPIYPHWKDYINDDSENYETETTNYISKVLSVVAVS